MSDGPDLSHFVQHRQLDVYEQSMARQGYAYGVDLRRARWLASSTVGNTLVRAVDRAWPKLAAHLMEEAFVEGAATPTQLLRELTSHMHLLRAPLPALRLLRREQRGRWPLVTALGATRGGSSWLILDAEALLALDFEKRAFLLGAGLGHLHCEHAVFFTAQLLATRREGNFATRTLRPLLAPWTKLMSFSADRAGLMCCARLDSALAVIESPPVAVGEGSPEAELSWLPSLPPVAQRVQALEEFARSAVFARVMATRSRQIERARELELPTKKTKTKTKTKAADADTDAGAAEEPGPIHVPADAWSLARVDARLTDRLGLL